MRPSRPLGAFIGLFACLAATNPVAAETRDIDQGFSISFPACVAGAHGLVPTSPGPGNDGAIHGCFVNIGQQGFSWEAQTGEWVLFRIRTGSFANQTDCSAANPSATAQLDGARLAVDTICQERPDGNWIVTFRSLSHPLAVGVHSVAINFSLSGFSNTVSDSLNVVQGG
jgi:hypothetical protein